jgi:hypothetical protein
MTHEEIIEALQSLAPKAEWTFAGDDYSKIEWLSEDPKPTLKQIEAEVANLEAKKAEAKINGEAAKIAAEAKLAALGLTADDLKALGL